MNRFFTSESVTEGHPDKVCDQIADAVLDAILAQDPNAHVACECCCTRDFLLIMGEVTANAEVDFDKIARDKIREIGYTEKGIGFDADTVKIEVRMNVQSADIAQGVNDSMEYADTNEEYDRVGAGDQGLMFGYAGNETEEKMPLAITLSHKICKKLAEVRKSGLLSYLRPDGKAQVTVEYDEKGNIVRVDTVVLSTQHDESVTLEKLTADVKENVIYPVAGKYIDKDTKVFINPTGRFVIGGPAGDSGLTGRKIIVDTYGGFVAHGGGSFSGKDPTKVDRSATYYARYVAKNLVASGICDRCKIQVAYAIGRATPVSIDVRTEGTGVVSDEKIIEIVKKVFDFRPLAIIRGLKLNRPQYAPTAAYGHFGDPTYAWEQTDKAEEIKKLYQ